MGAVVQRTTTGKVRRGRLKLELRAYEAVRMSMPLKLGPIGSTTPAAPVVLSWSAWNDDVGRFFNTYFVLSRIWTIHDD
jgi:hypothetical protein